VDLFRGKLDDALGIQIPSRVEFVLEERTRLVFLDLHSHFSTSLDLFGHPPGVFDVSCLSRFVVAAQQDDKDLSPPRKVSPVPPRSDARRAFTR
jgi:hypothetical protein